MNRRALAIFFTLWAVGVQVAELFAVIGVIGVAVVLVVEQANARRLPRLTLEWKLLIAFLAAALLLPLLAGNALSGTSFARLLALAAIPLAAAAMARLSERARRIAFAAAGITLLISCVAGGLQHFGAWPSADRMEGFAAVKLPFARVYEVVPGTEDRFMAGGLLFHRLKFAHVSSLFVLLAFAAALTTQRRARSFAFAVAGVGLVSVFWFPFARAAAVALLGAAIVLAVMMLRERRRLLFTGVGALAVVATLVLALNEPLRARLLGSDSEEGSGGRSMLFAAGLRATSAHPLWGIGQFRASDWLPEGAPAYVAEHQGKTHNQFLSIAAESGVIAALLFVAFLAALGRRLFTEGSVGFCLLLFFLALSALHDPLFHAEFGLALSLALGVSSRLGAPADVSPKVHPVE